MSSIIDLDDITSYMNKDLTSAVAQQIVDAVNQWIENKTNRVWGETKSVTERYDWKLITYLRHQDVGSVTSIRVGYPGQPQTTLDPNSYFVNRLGRLTFYSFGAGGGFRPGLGGSNRAFNDWLEVSYVYGVEDVPEDLKLAALGVASGFYNWASNGNKDIVASSVGSYSVQYMGARPNPTPNPALSTADANWAVIASYATRKQ